MAEKLLFKRLEAPDVEGKMYYSWFIEKMRTTITFIKKDKNKDNGKGKGKKTRRHR